MLSHSTLFAWSGEVLFSLPSDLNLWLPTRSARVSTSVHSTQNVLLLSYVENLLCATKIVAGLCGSVDGLVVWTFYYYIIGSI